jgi:Cys-rich repeat protein
MPDEGGQRSTWRALSAAARSMVGSIVVLLCALFGAVGCGGTTDNDTQGGFKCDNDEACYEYGQYCLGGRCAQCKEDRQCPEGFRCELGQCEHIVGFCAHNLPCPPGKRCRTNQCGPDCFNDKDCGLDQTCYRQFCVSNPKCVADSDCPLDMLCSQGICQRSTGCQLTEVFFDFNEYNVRADAVPVLEFNARCVSDQLRKNKEYSVYLFGHADERGNDPYNKGLSEQRAKSVSNSLGRLGINKAKIKAVGKGESEPAFPDARTPAQHQRNRRVEFRLRP